MSLPESFKQAVFREAGAPLTIEEVKLTPPSSGEVLVKVEACGVCFSDIYAQNNVMGGGLYVLLFHLNIYPKVAGSFENSNRTNG